MTVEITICGSHNDNLICLIILNRNITECLTLHKSSNCTNSSYSSVIIAYRSGLKRLVLILYICIDHTRKRNFSFKKEF